MARRLISLDDLYDYCKKNKLTNFKASSPEESLVVSIPAQYEARHCFANNYDDRFMNIHLKACHTLENLNKSFIKEEVMESALHTFKNCPVLASVVEKTDKDGNKYYDFNGHDMEIVDDPFNEDSERIHYIERAVGHVPSDATITLESEEGTDKKFVHADALIYVEYGNLTTDILEHRSEINVSVELAVDELSFDTKKKNNEY